jgi:hypothetical protein
MASKPTKGSASEFDKTSFNSSPMKSSATDPRADHTGGARTGAEPAKSRGVEHPIAEDMALYGDTRHALHTMPLPRHTGPNFGYGESAPSDQLRVDCGLGEAGEM